jgi:hypothetical protein
MQKRGDLNHYAIISAGAWSLKKEEEAIGKKYQFLSGTVAG